MKETIYTIPINDAFDDKNCECAICSFECQEENSRVEYTLGASMMEPDSRIITNEKGFCNRHIRMLYAFGNRLSLDLVLQTHIEQIIAKIEKSQVVIENVKEKTSVFAKSDMNANIENSLKELKKIHSSCAICEKLDDTMQKFMSNLFHMYKADSEFKEKIKASKGFCLKHFIMLLEDAEKYLKGNELKDFALVMYKLQTNNFKRIYDDVDWFAKKHDYRFAKDDWKTSKDAVERACQKTAEYI